MNRRGFLGAILAAACAPAIVRADALMRIVPRETSVLVGVDLAGEDDCSVVLLREEHFPDGLIRVLLMPQAEMNQRYGRVLQEIFVGPYAVPIGVDRVRLSMIGGGGS